MRRSVRGWRETKDSIVGGWVEESGERERKRVFRAQPSALFARRHAMAAADVGVCDDGQGQRSVCQPQRSPPADASASLLAAAPSGVVVFFSDQAEMGFAYVRDVNAAAQCVGHTHTQLASHPLRRLGLEGAREQDGGDYGVLVVLLLVLQGDEAAAWGGNKQCGAYRARSIAEATHMHRCASVGHAGSSPPPLPV